MYQIYFKRILDIIISITTIIILSPFLLIVSLLVKLSSSGPVFFIQTRIGKDFRKFDLIKFRTMTNEKRGVSKVYGREKGVTFIGYYLRRFKIDELPQIINVIKGDMSIVGPRPSIPSQLEKMNSEQKKRYLVRPGLTGLAQVSGNIYMDWQERYKFDLLYIRNVSIYNDFKIIFRTVLIVIKGEKKFLNKPLKIKVY